MNYMIGARRLAVACWLVGATMLAGCGGGGSSAAPATASASSTPAPSTSPADSGSSDMSNYVPPEDTGMPAGEEPYDGGTSVPGMESGSTETAMAPYGSSDASMPAYDGGMGSSYDGGMGSSYDGGMGSSYDGGMGMGYDGGMGMPGMGMPGMGMNGQPGMVDPAPSDDDDYMTKAKYAFAIGKERVAEKYFIAQLLTHDDEAPDLLKQVRWSPGQRKLTTTLRFAVGVDLSAPPNLDDVRPIGRSQIAQNSGGGAGGGSDPGMGMGSTPGGPGGQGAGGKSFGDLTGKFGEELIKAFETAWDNGDFGTAFKEVDTIIPVVRPQGGVNGMNGMSGSYDGGMGSSMMSPGMESGDIYGSGAAPGAAAPTDAALRLRATPDKVIVPGLTYLGTGEQSELAAKAEKEGIDFLFVYDVSVKAQRGLVQNDTRLRLINVKDGSNLGTTLSLNSLKVDRQTAMKGESDDVPKQVGNIFRKIEALRLTDLPKLEPVHAQARIKSLIEKNKDDALQTLMESRVFHAMGLLDDEQLNAAYYLTLGGSGVAFVSGTTDDRDAVLQPLLEPYK